VLFDDLLKYSHSS